MMKSVDVFQTALDMVSGTWSLAPVSVIQATEVTHARWNCVTWTVETMATVRVVHVSVTRVGMVKHVNTSFSKIQWWNIIETKLH